MWTLGICTFYLIRNCKLKVVTSTVFCLSLGCPVGIPGWKVCTVLGKLGTLDLSQDTSCNSTVRPHLCCCIDAVVGAPQPLAHLVPLSSCREQRIPGKGSFGACAHLWNGWWLGWFFFFFLTSSGHCTLEPHGNEFV